MPEPDYVTPAAKACLMSSLSVDKHGKLTPNGVRPCGWTERAI